MPDSRDHITISPTPDTIGVGIPVRVDAAAVGDRDKLLIHRLVARRIRRDPTLIEKTRTHLARMSTDPRHKEQAHEWMELLALPLPELQRLLSARTQTMARLRIGSPFVFMPEFTIYDPNVRRRIWRLARKGADLRLARSGRSRI